VDVDTTGSAIIVWRKSLSSISRDRAGVLSFGDRGRVAVFPGTGVVEWVDGESTAICPRCGIDAVLPGATGIGAHRERYQPTLAKATAAD
jgi:hypothetical protein